MNTFFDSLTPTQQASLAPRELEFTRLGCDFDEPPARIPSRDRLDPMLRRLVKGDMKGALETIRRLCDQHPGRLFYLTEYGVQLAASKRYDEAQTVFGQILDRNPDHTEALKYSGFVHFLQSQAGPALECLGAALRRQPGDVFANINYGLIRRLALPSARQETVPPMPETAVCTSLPPVNTDMSRKAVTSWIERGFIVYSVNTAEEKARLEPLFPDVRFYVCETTAKAKFGKDFQYLNTVMDCLYAAGTPVCGIINADIILRGAPEDWAVITHAGLDHCAYGSRVNMNSLDDGHGWIHEPGFDIFFFPREFTRQFPKAEFALGLPWWDMFLPNWAMASGLPMAFVHSPVAMHQNHAMNWDFNLYYDFGMYAIRRFLAPMLGQLVADNPGRNLYLRRLVAAVAFATKRTPKGAAKPIVCGSEQLRTAHAPIDPMHWVHLEYETLVMF